LAPFEKAARSGRLPSLDLKKARTSDLGRKFKAVLGGRPRPLPAPESAFGTGPSKYDDSDE
jgi:hypothetical protein